MRYSFILAAALLAAGPAAASDRTDIIAQVQKFSHGLDTGNMDEAFSTCASPMTIIDEFPPHIWSGAKGCQDWAAAFQANDKAAGITHAVAHVGKPRLVTVSGDTAYVVAPSIYSYRQHGKKVTESHASLTIAFRKTADTWLMTGWAWTSR